MLRICEVCHHGFWLHNQDDILCVPAECLDDELSLKLSICVFIRFVSHKCRNFRLRGFKKLQKKPTWDFWVDLRLMPVAEHWKRLSFISRLRVWDLKCVLCLRLGSPWSLFELRLRPIAFGYHLGFWLIRYSLRTSSPHSTAPFHITWLSCSFTFSAIDHISIISSIFYPI